MSGGGGSALHPARLLVEALRLDRHPEAELRRRGRGAVERGAGGFVLFGGTAGEAASLVAFLREEAGRPLWFAADLERGAGQQFDGLDDLPPPAALAHHPEPGRAVRTAARVTAHQARTVGVNWVLAPVLDLDVEPENPIVGTRSFGADPGRVASLGRAWIEACQAGGVAACMKHVPGHGRTTADSHAALPVVGAGADVLEDDLRPFRAASPVAATAMLAHVAVPALAEGSRRPATLEPLLARRLLRRELGFRGPAATDALNMAGFTAGGDGEAEGGRATEAVRAGCDLLLYPRDPAAAADGLRRACRRSAGFRDRVREARRRSRAALDRVAGSPPDGSPDATGFDLPDLDELAEACVIGAGASPGSVLPSDRAPVLRVIDDDDEPGTRTARPAFGEAFRETVEEEGVELAREDDAPDRRGGPAGREPSPAVLLIRSTPRGWKGRAGLGEEALRSVEAALGGGGPVYPVVFGHRRLLDGLDRPGACAWWGRPRAERAAARWLARRLRGAGAGT